MHYAFELLLPFLRGHVCHFDFLPDEGGFAYWGCPRCTPGQDAPHFLGCELIGWNVPMPIAPTIRGGGIATAYC